MIWLSKHSYVASTQLVSHSLCNFKGIIWFNFCFLLLWLGGIIEIIWLLQTTNYTFFPMPYTHCFDQLGKVFLK